MLMIVDAPQAVCAGCCYVIPTGTSHAVCPERGSTNIFWDLRECLQESSDRIEDNVQLAGRR